MCVSLRIHNLGILHRNCGYARSRWPWLDLQTGRTRTRWHGLKRFHSYGRKPAFAEESQIQQTRETTWTYTSAYSDMRKRVHT